MAIGAAVGLYKLAGRGCSQPGDFRLGLYLNLEAPAMWTLIGIVHPRCGYGMRNLHVAK